RVFRTMEDCDAEIDTYGVDRQRREEHRPLGPLEYNGYKLFETLRDAFFETYRETDAGIVKSESVVSSRKHRQFVTEHFPLTCENST
ncbi:hypothetical protein V1522DRAFT_351548, partial [Lipomyces starkeyi]